MLFLEVIRFFRITLPIGGRVTPLHALYKNVFSHRLLRLIHCALKKCIDFEQFGLKFVALPTVAKTRLGIGGLDSKERENTAVRSERAWEGVLLEHYFRPNVLEGYPSSLSP